MCVRKIILLCLLILLGDRLFAATFTVTSNADSGPGTLRQALNDALLNGSNTVDYIYFNLPATTGTQADITISLLQPLSVPRNVVIDASTQPTPAIGVSGARVIITTSNPTPTYLGFGVGFNAFNLWPSLQADDVMEFYGLYIVGFGPYGGGIYSQANCKLVVGAPGKGNVFCNLYFGVAQLLQNAIIQSNFFGLEPDGVTPSINQIDVTASGTFNNMLIGGPNADEGNVVLAGVIASLQFAGTTFPPSPNTATIQNNFFGTNYNASAAINVGQQPFIEIAASTNTLNVIGNTFSASQAAIDAEQRGNMVVKGNFFGTNSTQTVQLGNGMTSGYGAAIYEYQAGTAIIGGTTTADQNVFTGYKNPIQNNNAVTNVIQNSFYCNQVVQLTDPSHVNYIRIISLLPNSASGDAPPGATVQLYYSVPTAGCPECNPNTWFYTTTADNNGHWTYSGAVLHNVMASSTVNGSTYGFQTTLAPSEVKVVNADCNGGSLSLVEPRTGNFQIQWTNATTGQIVGTTQSVNNLPPGTYNLTISEGAGCPSQSGQFTIVDVTPKVYGSSAPLNCLIPTATFTEYPSLGPNITVAEYHWTDASGHVLPNQQTISGLAAGTYYLYIVDSNGCQSNTATFTVTPATPAPIIDDSGATPIDADCGAATGSIVGMKVTNLGAANYGWKNAVNGSLFSYEQMDLTNAPPGKYYFFVQYEATCPPVISQTFTIAAKNVVSLDESGASAKSATCTNNNGSITGILAPGATTYTWYNKTTGQPAGNLPDLANIPAGAYYLVASNATCSKTSQIYTVNYLPPVVSFPSAAPVIQNATCNLGNGGITVAFNDPANLPASYRWANAGGTTLYTKAPLTNAAAGTYQLFVTDNNGCESLYNTYQLPGTPLLQIQAGSGQVNGDQCGLGTGSIQNVNVTGGIPPYTYHWISSSTNNSVGTASDISGLTAGTYTLQVRDATACGLATQDFTLPDIGEFVPAPELSDFSICAPGPTIIAVKNPQQGYSYRLYDSQSSTGILADETTGVFKITVPDSRSYYLTQYTGTCESTRTEVMVRVGLSSVDIPNTFTPNNDGINDVWTIKDINEYPDALVQIFNRYGQRVFESKGYPTPFDGTMNGSPLPTGVYYYIINLNSKCSLISGSLTLIR